MTENFTPQLEAVLSREVEGFAALISCQQLSAGASQETYCITLKNQSGETKLALRRSQPTAQSGSSVGAITLETEAQLFQLAGANDIPGPAVVYVLQATDELGVGFIMEWLDGETMGQRINRSEELAAIRAKLAHDCGEILGRIHLLDWQDTQLANSLPQIEPTELVDETWALYRDLNVPVPMIDYTWRWLKDNLPQDTRRTLVHGDFRNGNLMVTPTGINAVLDWELAHIGDPARDLGWLCVNSWRFGSRDLPVGGFGSTADLLSGYRAATGIEISQQTLTFWQVFGSFWWAMATLQMANAWRTGDTPSLERPVIGRRSSEAQMDCVNLLIPGDFDLPNTEQTNDTGTQLPMPAELLEGVARFLKEDVAAQLDPHNHFLAKVAANSLRIAQREFEHGPQLQAAEEERLNALVQKTGKLDDLRWQLVHSLRESMPLDTPGLQSHLRQTVASQLFIDQPRYSALSSTTHKTH